MKTTQASRDLGPYSSMMPHAYSSSWFADVCSTSLQFSRGMAPIWPRPDNDWTPGMLGSGGFTSDGWAALRQQLTFVPSATAELNSAQRPSPPSTFMRTRTWPGGSALRQFLSASRMVLPTGPGLYCARSVADGAVAKTCGVCVLSRRRSLLVGRLCPPQDQGVSTATGSASNRSDQILGWSADAAP